LDKENKILMDLIKRDFVATFRVYNTPIYISYGSFLVLDGLLDTGLFTSVVDYQKVN